MVTLTGGPSQKLSGPLTAGGDVYEFKISADSSRVVYTADQDVYNQFEIYSVSLTGPINPPTKLNPPFG